jgi:hypothetical protein
MQEALIVDGHRLDAMDRGDLEPTGIYVRALYGDRWGSYDATTLTKESLTVWLRSRGGVNQWAEDVIYILLKHGV